MFMNVETLLDKITLAPSICHSKPVVRGLRYPVESILDYLAAGDGVEEILAEFPDLEEGDILACIAYASHTIKTKSLMIRPIAA
jgi:uncharacterized protein (DUF433 family)